MLNERGADRQFMASPSFRLRVRIYVVRKEYPLDELICRHGSFGRNKLIHVQLPIVLDATAKPHSTHTSSISLS